MVHRGRRGAAALASLLIDAVDPQEIESLFELRFLKYCQAWTLPRPRTQVEFGIYRADFLFEEFGVVVETDSLRWHSTAARRARDARKTTYLESLGLIVVRVTWQELHDDPAGVYARILAAFERSNRT